MPTFNVPRGLFLAKLLTPFIVVSLLGTTAIVAVVYLKGSQLLETQFKQRVLDEFNFLEYEFREDGAIELLEEIEERIEKSQHTWRFLYQVHGPTGAKAFDDLPPQPKIGWNEMPTPPYAETSLLYNKVLEGGYQLVVGISMDDLHTYRRTFITNAGWLLAAGILISTLFSSLVYFRFVSIIKAIAEPVQQFSDGQFSARINALGAGPDIKKLAGNINTMFDQIARLLKQQKSLSANLAHELRTPLTRAKQHLENAESTAALPTRNDILLAQADIDETLSLFREILYLSEIQSGRLQTYFTPINLSSLINECLEMYAPLLEEQNVQIKKSIPDGVTLLASPQLLKQVMVNLIENSLSHSEGNSVLQIAITVDGAQVTLEVNDTGKKRSATPTRQHHGLGLNIITAIIELHGGTVHFRSTQSGGFCCTIQLSKADGQKP